MTPWIETQNCKHFYSFSESVQIYFPGLPAARAVRATLLATILSLPGEPDRAPSPRAAGRCHWTDGRPDAPPRRHSESEPAGPGPQRLPSRTPDSDSRPRLLAGLPGRLACPAVAGPCVPTAARASRAPVGGSEQGALAREGS